MMVAIQEVMFHIQLAYEYNEFTKKSNAYVMRRMRRTNTATRFTFGSAVPSCGSRNISVLSS